MSQHSWFASKEVRALLLANRLSNLEDAFELGAPLDDLHEGRASRHQFKRVVTLELNEPPGRSRVYIKRQWRRARWIPRLTDIRRGIGLKCSPIEEWRGLRLLKDAGFDVAEPLALFWRGWGTARGAVVTRAVPPRHSLADMILRGDLQQMDPDRRNSLIEAAVQVVAQLHRAEVSWRSMKSKHFYPEEMPDGNWRIWLIDCESVHRGASLRQRQRDWRNYLNYIGALVPALRETFVSAYALKLSHAS